MRGYLLQIITPLQGRGDTITQYNVWPKSRTPIAGRVLTALELSALVWSKLARHIELPINSRSGLPASSSAASNSSRKKKWSVPTCDTSKSRKHCVILSEFPWPCPGDSDKQHSIAGRQRPVMGTRWIKSSQKVTFLFAACRKNIIYAHHCNHGSRSRLHQSENTSTCDIVFKAKTLLTVHDACSNYERITASF